MFLEQKFIVKFIVWSSTAPHVPGNECTTYNDEIQEEKCQLTGHMKLERFFENYFVPVCASICGSVTFITLCRSSA